MRYLIFGRDQESGQPVEPFVVDAEDEADARNRVAELGTVVDRVVPAPAEVPVSDVAPDSAAMDHVVARGLVWVLRALALIAAIWGLVNIADASRAAREAAKEFRAFPGGREQMAKAAERAGTTAVFTAVVLATALVAVLLAMAECLRLCIQIERNTRKSGQLRAREQG
jgi:hypothetical protein